MVPHVSPFLKVAEVCARTRFSREEVLRMHAEYCTLVLNRSASSVEPAQQLPRLPAELFPLLLEQVCWPVLIFPWSTFGTFGVWRCGYHPIFVPRCRLCTGRCKPSYTVPLGPTIPLPRLVFYSFVKVAQANESQSTRLLGQRGQLSPLSF